MGGQSFDVVTGAFGYTGKYIARRLLEKGRRVMTLTGRPNRPNPFGRRVRIEPFNFDKPVALMDSLRGADTFYNTYWVRFPRHGLTFDTAVTNTRALIRAATKAKVRRFVHISVANPSDNSPLGYFRGKAVVERIITESALSYAIIRPTVVFGQEDILINNIAWFLRKLPVFGIPGHGKYRLQPVFVDDLAKLAVRAGRGRDNVVMDAAGPETFTFEQMVRHIATAIGSKSRIFHMNARLAVMIANLVGLYLGDVTLTREEVEGLMANLLVSDQPPTGNTAFTDWLADHADHLGLRYTSELARHYK